MKHFAIVVDWYGPYTLAAALEAARYDYSTGLYVGLGKLKYERGRAKPQYIGLSKNLRSRIANHHKLPYITKDMSIWLGEVATADPSGRKRKTTATSLDYAEWLHAFFLQLPLNRKKTVKAPDRSVTVLNRWWKTDYETPRVHRAHPLWPDLIDFIGPRTGAKVVWFGKKQERVKPPFMIRD